MNTSNNDIRSKARRDEAWRAQLRKDLSTKERMSLPHIEGRHAPYTRSLADLHQEASLGYTEEEARQEARRCIDCPNPGCQAACPAHINIPSFIKNIERGNYPTAFGILRERSTLSAICGRVCDQERQCEGGCIYSLSLKKQAVSIGKLERFVATQEALHRNEWAEQTKPLPLRGQRVAIIGSGPAGLAAAHDLSLLGYSVTIFEALDVLGGVMRTGIPRFRLPSEIIDDEIERLISFGVVFRSGVALGKDITFEGLKQEGYEAFFVATGAPISGKMGIEGEGLPGVFLSGEYLMRTGLSSPSSVDRESLAPLQGKVVAVIGGGNTAMDAVRTALRLGAERAIILYRRGRQEMPANREELEDALAEGAELMELHMAHHYEADETGRVKYLFVERMELGEPDESGRRSPKGTGELMRLEIDRVVVSVGVYPDPLVAEAIPTLKTGRNSTIVVNELQESSLPWVFAGGDATRGGATVVEAMVDGRRAAQAIHYKLSGERVDFVGGRPSLIDGSEE